MTVRVQRASHMFKVSNFKTSVLWAVKGKLRKLLGLLKERATEKGTGEATLDIQVNNRPRGHGRGEDVV
jgi:hypothetical protein